ncbi:MAG: nitroreductase family protein [Dehalococcoidia bacterium]|nr:nitroreductase family protein [Dehalococcoidia bacterium]
MAGVTPVVSDIFEAMGTQRAMRRLKPDPVPDELIQQLLWAATRAPNGGNVQPWRFIVVQDPATKQALQRIYKTQWDRYIANLPPPPPGTRPSAGAYLAEHMHEAPVLIIPCGFLLDINSGIASGSSIYPAVQNILLAARALGLGAALTTLHRQDEGAVRELLGIPENAHVACVIPVGWPMGKFGPVNRKPPEEVTYWDHWGAKRG